MAELGETTDPRDLIPGDPGSLRASAQSMTRFGDALVRAGSGLRGIDDGGWRGDAASAFHDYFDGQPSKWITCGEAFHSASGALTHYASTLEWAQDQGRQALALWQQGEPARTQARHVLETARSQLAAAGDDAARVVDAAQEHAPAKPNWWDKAVGAVESAVDTVAGSTERGIGRAVDSVGNTIATGIGQGARDLGKDIESSLGDLGRASGQSWLTSAGREVDDALASAGDHAEDLVRDSAAYARNEMFDIAHATDGRSAQALVYIDPDEYPETALHIRQAQAGLSWHGDQQLEREQPARLTIDRDAGRASRRGQDALRGIPSKGHQGLDREEYPPKMFSESGRTASVKYVYWKDAQSAGRSMGAQTRGLGNGTVVEIDAGH